MPDRVSQKTDKGRLKQPKAGRIPGTPWRQLTATPATQLRSLRSQIGADAFRLRTRHYFLWANPEQENRLTQRAPERADAKASSVVLCLAEDA